MIKINLLPQRRPKGRTASSEVSAQPLLIGVFCLVAAGVAVWVVVDHPRRARLDELEKANEQLDKDIATKGKQLVGYTELKAAEEEANRRLESIQLLLRARVVPAHLLHELGEILTTNHYPTMTEEMVRRTGNGPGSDPNKRFQADWDPSHVWLTAFNDNAGLFSLEGGALTGTDVDELAKRLEASVYFQEGVQSRSSRVADNTGSNFVKFTITGRVVY